MKALITGASSGIGYSMAKYLGSLGYDLILVARDKEKLQNIQKEIKTDVKIIVADVSQESKLKELYVLCKNDNIDILINNAGFGLFGEFDSTDLSTELSMIDVNLRAVHVLTKLFLKDMVKRDSGYILNVSSSASFQAGPLMSTYYASKAYVTRLTVAIYEELRRKAPSESSSDIKERVDRAREIQRRRFHDDGTMYNAYMSNRELRTFCALTAEGEELMHDAFDSMGLSARSHDRILRVARTIADLDDAEQIGDEHIAEAIQFRTYDFSEG